MATRLVALIRGINVGRAKRVAMGDLRAAVEGLGYGDVRTLLNSGNVVFTARGAGSPATAAARIEKALASDIGVPARVTVLTAAEMASIITGNPLGKVAGDPSRLMVTVLLDPTSRAELAPIVRQKWAPEAVALGTRVVYAWCPRGIMDSPLFDAMQRVLRDGSTTRNWATMTKLHALAAAEATRGAP